MNKWFNFLKQVFLKFDYHAQSDKDFFYQEELKRFEEQENLRRTQYLSSFSKGA